MTIALARGASESFSAVGRRIDAARAWTLEAQAHADLGEGERAVELLRRAHSELGACGARRYQAAAARGLRKLGRPVAARAARDVVAADGPLAALSQREYEVAQLVARGLRNREIAEALVLSPKTVETHLTHIFAKLGVSSRVQVVRLVQRD